MAEKACHVVASTTHFGLTQALGRIHGTRNIYLFLLPAVGSPLLNSSICSCPCVAGFSPVATLLGDDLGFYTVGDAIFGKRNYRARVRPVRIQSVDRNNFT